MREELWKTTQEKRRGYAQRTQSKNVESMQEERNAVKTQEQIMKTMKRERRKNAGNTHRESAGRTHEGHETRMQEKRRKTQEERRKNTVRTPGNVGRTQEKRMQ